MWQYELYPSRLINVATPPCESLITAGYHQRKLHQMYHSFVKVGQGHHVPYSTFTYLGCYTAKHV